MKKIVLFLMVLAAVFAAEKKFEVVSVDGKKFHFLVSSKGVKCEEAKGKVLMVDFFGKNCPPCRASIPILAKINKNSKKVFIVGLHVQQKLSPSDLLNLKKLGINYPIIDMMGSKNNYKFVEFLGGMSGWQGSIPFMLFFDKNGNYVAQHYGMVDYDGLKKFIDSVYKEKN